MYSEAETITMSNLLCVMHMGDFYSSASTNMQPPKVVKGLTPYIYEIEYQLELD